MTKKRHGVLQEELAALLGWCIVWTAGVGALRHPVSVYDITCVPTGESVA